MYRDSINNKLKARQANLGRLIDRLEQLLPTYPEGNLRIDKKTKTPSYYFYKNGENSNGKILNPEDFKLAQNVAQRTYYKKVLKAAQEEKKLVDQFIKRFPDPSVEEVYERLSENRQALISPVALSDEDYLEQWLSKPYTHKLISNDIPYYMTMNEERVRSKSEQIIADRLKAKNIPYKYECPVKLYNGKTVHPDFTILRLSDRKEVYYEHLGRMDDPEYAEDNVRKINDYSLSGYTIGDKLFTTMETKNHPLDTRVLDELIDKEFK